MIIFFYLRIFISFERQYLKDFLGFLKLGKLDFSMRVTFLEMFDLFLKVPLSFRSK